VFMDIGQNLIKLTQDIPRKVSNLRQVK
jgi:hypothetical protein